VRVTRKTGGVHSLRIKLSEVKEGCILAADVYSRTNLPIIPKKTVISKMHINVLEAFNVEEIEIERVLINGVLFHINEIEMNDEDPNILVKQLGFSGLFLSSVTKYKKEFRSWQSGLPINIAKVREILLPLLEIVEMYPCEIFNIHRYSTKESYIYHHPLAVGLISGFIGMKMQLEKGDWLQVALAGCLADCGMAKINPTILLKNSSLTLQEYLEVKKHPVYSYKMVRNISVLRREVKLAILEHHERLDGSGYPFGEREKIPLYAKIIGIADIFHAMTSERLYRNKQSPYKVLEMILEENFGKFDIRILKILTSSIIDFSTGDKIRLSNGKMAEVLFVDEKSPTRPLIKIIDTDEILQLSQNRQIFIENVISS
jgi:HD-GYP domain-containing protein (c-di-GMP phosphodiesterase class II)